jgi:hypothetical protein
MGDAVTRSGTSWDQNPSHRFGSKPAAANARGVPVYLPPLRDVPGVDIHVEIAGVPPTAVLSAGHELPTGLWSLRGDEIAGLRLLPAGAFAENGLLGPVSLEVTFLASDPSTGRVGSMTTTGDIPGPWDSAPGRSGRCSRTDGGVRYLLADDAGGRFAIDPYSGLVTVADAAVLEPEAPRRHRITVQIAMPDGALSFRRYEIALRDHGNEFSITELPDGAVGDADAWISADVYTRRALPLARTA